MQSAAADGGGGDPLSPGFGMYARQSAPSDPRSSAGGGRAINGIANGVEYRGGATTYDVERIRRAAGGSAVNSSAPDATPAAHAAGAASGGDDRRMSPPTF